MTICQVCEWRPATRRGRCGTCYAYWRRNGRYRPEDLIVAEGRRALERDMERRLRRQILARGHRE